MFSTNIKIPGNSRPIFFGISRFRDFKKSREILTSNNNQLKLKSLYFRCKNSSGIYQCPARAIAKNKNLKNVKLTKQHCNHKPEKSVLAKTQFDKKLDKCCDDVDLIPLRSSYGSFFSRLKSKVKPRNPKSIEEFEDLINKETFRT